MTIDLRVVRAILLLGATVLFLTAAGMSSHHAHKTVVLVTVGLALLAFDRLVDLFVGARRGEAR
jgi:hypothetical protein